MSLQSSVLESCLIIKGHCAASRKVAVSIPDDVVGIFIDLSLPASQPLRNITPKNKAGICVGLTTLPHSCAACLEIWKTQPPETLKACPGLCRGLLLLYPEHYVVCSYLILSDSSHPSVII